MQHTNCNRLEDSGVKKTVRNEINRIISTVARKYSTKPVFSSLPGENADQETRLWELMSHPMHYHMFEINPQIFNNFKGFHEDNLTTSTDTIKHYKFGTSSADYSKREFVIRDDSTSFWADYFHCPSKHVVDTLVHDINNHGELLQSGFVTFTRSSRHRDMFLHPEIKKLMESYKSTHKSEDGAFISAVTDYLNLVITRDKTLILSCVYTNMKSLVITLGWVFEKNSKIEPFFYTEQKKENTKKMNKKNSTTKSLKTRLMEVKHARVNLLSQQEKFNMIRDTLRSQPDATSKSLALYFRVSIGTIAAIKANLNR